MPVLPVILELFSRMKGEIAVEICSVLAFSAIKNNDRVGLIIFSDKIEKYIPPKKGRKHVLRLIRELLYFEPENKGTDISVALDFLAKVTKRKCVVFLVSDFIAKNYDKSLRVAARRHDLIAISVSDPREEELPKIGFLTLEDAETGEVMIIDTYSSSIINNFKKLGRKALEERERLFKANKIDEIKITTDVPYVRPLMRFFRERVSKVR